MEVFYRRLPVAVVLFAVTLLKPFNFGVIFMIVSILSYLNGSL